MTWFEGENQSMRKCGILNNSLITIRVKWGVKLTKDEWFYFKWKQTKETNLKTLIEERLLYYITIIEGVWWTILWITSEIEVKSK